MKNVFFSGFPIRLKVFIYPAIACIIMFFTTGIKAQLKPGIGISGLPADTVKICNIPIAKGSGVVPGYAPGTLVPDFKLFTVAGDSIVLSEILKTNTPVLLISSSYTCPVFRGKIPVINQVDSIYKGKLRVFIIYTVEAHPIVDVSPYSGNVWTTSENQSQGILFEQPKTYGDRKAVVQSMLSKYNIASPVLLDGPCNPWWLNYGTRPNSATLIRSNGTVFSFQDWLHKSPANIFCDIDSLLGIKSGMCNKFGSGGSFTMLSDSIAYGIPGSVLSVHATLTNTSKTDNVTVGIQRMGTQMPVGWETALCIDVCYPASTSQAQVTIPPGETQEFIFYFYTDTISATGMAQVRFRNMNNTSNQYTQKYYANTKLNLGPEINCRPVTFYPNPVENVLMVGNISNPTPFVISDLQGKIVKYSELNSGNNYSVGMQNLQSGMYVIRLMNDNKTGKIIVKR